MIEKGELGGDPVPDSPGDASRRRWGVESRWVNLTIRNGGRGAGCARQEGIIPKRNYEVAEEITQSLRQIRSSVSR